MMLEILARGRVDGKIKSPATHLLKLRNLQILLLLVVLPGPAAAGLAICARRFVVYASYALLPDIM